MSRPPAWVSQVAYRIPAASAASAPSIHQMPVATDPLSGAIGTGFDQVFPPSPDEVKYTCPGPSVRVLALVIASAW